MCACAFFGALGVILIFLARFYFLWYFWRGMKEYEKFTNNPNSVDTRGVFKLFGCFNDQSANEMRKKPENFKFEIGFTVVI